MGRRRVGGLGPTLCGVHSGLADIDNENDDGDKFLLVIKKAYLVCVYVGGRWAEALGPLQSASFSLFLLLSIFLVSKLKEKGQEITRSSDLT